MLHFFFFFFLKASLTVIHNSEGSCLTCVLENRVMTREVDLVVRVGEPLRDVLIEDLSHCAAVDAVLVSFIVLIHPSHSEKLPLHGSLSGDDLHFVID